VGVGQGFAPVTEILVRLEEEFLEGERVYLQEFRMEWSLKMIEEVLLDRLIEGIDLVV